MAANIGSEDGDLGFQIAPMVDVVFVLLLFFMASVGYKLVEKELPIQISSNARHPHGERTPIVIDIGSNGQVSVNGVIYGTSTESDLSRLSTWLAQIVTEFGEDPVILRPSADSRHERIIDVLNACTVAKVKNVSFM